MVRLLVAMGTSLQVGEFRGFGARIDESGLPEAEWIDVTEDEAAAIRSGHIPTIVFCSECGKPEGSFACKIRHVQLNTGDAKASRD